MNTNFSGSSIDPSATVSPSHTCHQMYNSLKIYYTFGFWKEKSSKYIYTVLKLPQRPQMSSNQKSATRSCWKPL